jgi:outer membrane receptor for ferrienterochelin and colicins
MNGDRSSLDHTIQERFMRILRRLDPRGREGGGLPPLALILTLSFVLVLLPATPASAQNASIAGVVTNEQTGQPVTTAFLAAVDSEGREVGTSVTNGEGRYRIVVSPGSYRVTISGIGYGTRTLVTVELSEGEAVSVDFAIPWQPIDLATVTVSVGRVPERTLGAPAHVEVISGAAVRDRPVTTPAGHLRSLPAVDIITQGLQSTNVVVRGFNNIFSGALHTLTDHRIAGVPSLRVNVMNFIPAASEDVDRMEVVLGPGAALYGPNTANGVLHVMTRSPLEEPSSSISVLAGERSVFGGTFRTSQHLGNSLGVKVSGQYFRGDEWSYLDDSELVEREKFDSNREFWRNDLMRATGVGADEADRRIDRISARSFDIERWSGEVRADWALSEAATAVFTAGVANAGRQIELTGLGAAQVRDWQYSFVQARLRTDRLFAQAYVNRSDAGETFLLRTGAPIVDRSVLMVAQIQHRTQFGPSQQFTYGADLLYTDPETEGTINGIYEDEDDTTEIGVYLQSETRLSPTLNLVLAGRVDDHSALPSPVFSPRAALVLQPREDQAFRISYNRAFSTPSSLNQFLDLGTAMPASLAQASLLGYSVRIQGTGTEGFSFRTGEGPYLMRSPFTPAGLGGPAQLVPAGMVAGYWPAAVEVLHLQGVITDPVREFMLSLEPTPAEVGGAYAFQPAPGASRPLSELELRDVSPIREETQSTIEVGYKGLLGERALIAADVWYSRRDNLVTPLLVQTPFVTLDPSDVHAYLVQQLNQFGVPAGGAQAIAAAMATVPLGVISSADVNANGAQLLSTFTNVDETIDFWGLDITGTVLLHPDWSVMGGISLVSASGFDVESLGQVVTLNAPRQKGSLALNYHGQESRFTGELRVRHTGSFPANSGVYVGTACLATPPLPTDPCVRSSTQLNVNMSYELPQFEGASLQLAVQNALDSAHQSFPGTPEVGRMALVRMVYRF